MDRQPLFLGAIWEPYADETACCVIITEPDRGIVRDTHDHMPLVLDDDSLAAWLDPALTDREAIRSAVHHLDAGALTAWPVSTRVNRVAHEGADIAAIEAELEDLNLTSAAPAPKKTPRRAPLPPELPRIEIRHDPESEHRACGCQLRRIVEEISEKLDYAPGVFHVERHIRGKWVCDQCETLTLAPMPAQKFAYPRS